jgi:D-alanyl-D-alanine dipeptidase
MRLKNFVFAVLSFFAISAAAQKPVGTAVSDTAFVDLNTLGADFVYDMKYATDDNFLKAKVYDCGVCMLRLKTANALVAASKAFAEKGYKIKIFDCYRPLDIQKKMWAIVPNPNYVADPAKGSIHNRGGAVDITIVDKNGEELDMGTAFDFFGEAASHDYRKLSRKVRRNRALLKAIMEQNGFSGFGPEWWHYNLSGAKDPVSNFKWKCD